VVVVELVMLETTEHGLCFLPTCVVGEMVPNIVPSGYSMQILLAESNTAYLHSLRVLHESIHTLNDVAAL